MSDQENGIADITAPFVLTLLLAAGATIVLDGRLAPEAERHATYAVCFCALVLLGWWAGNRTRRGA
ncbi:MAG: hypothetical protein JHD16_00065 [Solirubrobacteraceae bacterium]|nr:hypothetical protein [Solirubrobacteraceae bacterium]